MAKKKVVKEPKRYLPFDELDYQMDLDWIYSDFKEYKKKLVIIELDVVETGIELESGIVDLDTFDIPSNSTLVVDLNKDKVTLSDENSEQVNIVVDLFKSPVVSLEKGTLPIVSLKRENQPSVNIEKVEQPVVNLSRDNKIVVSLNKDVKILVDLSKVVLPVVNIVKDNSSDKKIVVSLSKGEKPEIRVSLVKEDIVSSVNVEEVNSIENKIVVSLNKEEDSNVLSEVVDKDNNIIDEPPSFEARKGAVFVDMSDDEDEELSDVSSVESVEDIETRVAEAYKKKQLELEEEKSKKKKLKKAERSKTVSKFVIAGMIVAAIALVVVIILIINWKREGSAVTEIVDNYTEQAVEVIDYGIVVNDIEQNISLVDVDFTEMLQANSDIVGWLKIEAIGLDYPIVKSSDNDFYLNHDLEKKQNAAGWLFLDYHNSIESIDFNSVIYGHNRRDAVMFGGLKKFLDANVRNKENGKYVYFTTLRNQMIFEICSIYTVEYTNEIFYNTEFIDDAKKQEFIDFIQANNTVEDIKTDLSTSDRFLTLSTCHGGSGTTKRLVVHCKLLSSKAK